MWNARPPDLNHLKTWGCKVLYHERSADKLEPRARTGIFILYTKSDSQYQIHTKHGEFKKVTSPVFLEHRWGPLSKHFNKNDDMLKGGEDDAHFDDNVREKDMVETGSETEGTIGTIGDYIQPRRSERLKARMPSSEQTEQKQEKVQEWGEDIENQHKVQEQPFLDDFSDEDDGMRKHLEKETGTPDESGESREIDHLQEQTGHSG